MKKLFVIGLVLLFPSLLFADKDDISEFDGNNWTRFTPIEKLSFVNGFISASDYIISAGSGYPFYSEFSNRSPCPVAPRWWKRFQQALLY